MKNILVITPFYPFPQRKDLLKDTRVVYDLCKTSNEDENVIILYYYLHNRMAAVKAMPRLLKIRNYQQCLYKDDVGHDVLLFEHPGFIPHRYKTFGYFDKKYAALLQDYLMDRGIKLDCIAVHFPSRFTPLCALLEADYKTAIIHSFDIASEERMELVKDYLPKYDCIGFRSKQIEERMFPYVNQKKRFLCLSGVPDEIIPQTFVPRPWKTDGVLKLIYVGKLIDRKNVATIISALGKIKQKILFQLMILGDGEERENIERQILKEGLEESVKLMGNLPREEVFEKLEESDIFILVSFRETLGLAYLEAISQGCVVIGSKGRGIDGLVKDRKEAFFVDPTDADQLADHLLEIYNMSEEQINQIRKTAYEFVVNLKDSEVSRGYLQTITNQRTDD